MAAGLEASAFAFACAAQWAVGSGLRQWSGSGVGVGSGQWPQGSGQWVVGGRPRGTEAKRHRGTEAQRHRGQEGGG